MSGCDNLDTNVRPWSYNVYRVRQDTDAQVQRVYVTFVTHQFIANVVLRLSLQRLAFISCMQW